MKTLKKFCLGKTEIEICSNANDEEIKQNLIDLYDLINNIANEKRQRGENVDDLFYTEKEIKQMQQDPKYKFI